MGLSTARGVRSAEPDDLPALRAAARAGNAVSWLGLFEPSVDEVAFDLHELTVEESPSKRISGRSWSGMATRCPLSYGRRVT